MEKPRKGWPSAKLVGRLVLCFLISALTVAAAPQHQKVVPAWSTDLRSTIGSTPVPILLGNGDEESNGPVTSLHFKDDNTIVATYVVHEDKSNPKLSNRGEDQNLPLLLRAIFLDAATGKITTTHDWPSGSSDAYIVTASGGKIVTLAGDKLTLYGIDLEKVRSVTLPPLRIGWWGAQPSFTGKNMLVETPDMSDPGKHRELRLWVQTDPLEIIHSWDPQPFGSVSITDDEMLLSTWCDYADCLGLELRNVSSDWKVIGPGYTEPDFVDESTFFLRGDWNQKIPAQLVRTNGEIIFADKRPSEGGVRWGRPVVSSEGKRFVAPGLKGEGGNDFLDIDGHVVLKTLLVCDLPVVKQPQVLDVNAPAIKDVMQFALSPDGSRLAVLNKEIMYVFDLPAKEGLIR